MDVLRACAADDGGQSRLCLPADPLPQPAGSRGAHLNEGCSRHLVRTSDTMRFVIAIQCALLVLW